MNTQTTIFRGHTEFSYDVADMKAFVQTLVDHHSMTEAEAWKFYDDRVSDAEGIVRNVLYLEETGPVESAHVFMIGAGEVGGGYIPGRDGAAFRGPSRV